MSELIDEWKGKLPDYVLNDFKIEAEKKKLTQKEMKTCLEEIKKRLGRDLEMNLKIREILNKFDNEKYNYLIRLLNQDKVKDFLVSKGDMDYPTRFGFGLAIREPRFLRFLF